MSPQRLESRTTAVAGPREYVLISLVSGSVLAYEFLLSRLLTIRYWSTFAAMIVSLAMLGFAASGTVLFIMGRVGGHRLRLLHGRLLPAFALSIPVCFRVSSFIDCQPLALLWDPGQLWRFAANYIVLAVPFFLGGLLIGYYFFRTKLPASRIHFANMAGAAAGIGIALLLPACVSLAGTLQLVAIPLLCLAVIRDHRPLTRIVVFLSGLAILWMGAPTTAIPRMSEYKELAGVLLLPDAAIETQFSSPFGEMCVVGSRHLRYAPGLSLNFDGTVPRQKTIFADGDAVSVVCAWDEEEQLRRFSETLLSALPYRLVRRPNVLLTQAAGIEILTAFMAGAAAIDVVERNPNVSKLLRGPLREFAGQPFQRGSVNLLPGNSLLFARETTNRYDLVVLPTTAPPFASAAGTAAHDPDYLLTREGLACFFRLLNPGGALIVHTWMNVPPRDEIKAFATAFEALGRENVPSAASHLLLARAVRTAVVVIFRDPVTSEQVSAVEAFCEDMGFDLVFYPGISSQKANRFNRIEGAPHFTMARRIADGEAPAVYRAHVYDIAPCSEDRPYFSHFFRWASLRQLLGKTGPNVAVQIGWGYMFLLVSLAQAAPLGIVLILIPLAAAGRKSGVPRPARLRAYTYFAAIGLGYMFVEMAAIQQYSRFTRHPVVAFAVVLGVLLGGSGLGALASSHQWMTRRRTFAAVVALIAGHVVVWEAALCSGSRAGFGAAVLALFALAFFMGAPFPKGITALRSSAGSLIPWAWGINGFASVVSVLVAGLLALALGHRAVALLAALSYATAAFSFPAARTDRDGTLSP